MKVITPMHLRNWRENVPELLSVEHGEARPDALVMVVCRFANPVPRGPEVVERYLLDTSAA